ncbi:F-box domain-containing protein [Metarhizium robertsii ARSEF 23]|uniref:F-box domain-containing protein n=1 Tax=Metarhizium robertsii (strain ARSEF 23 / ATCC MYA-3075) TaxID=655844 RepID=E9F4D0_METRA|nr:F-box domain-containing protein [Metarhizium robertsii ARSEF 23]EFY97487.2 F-box domain-containing protein [Metarhizium robertsii ARSEF 23]
MSPSIFSCVLCGYIILNYEDPSSASWENQFRLLYISPTGVAVTGVGIYNDPDDGWFIAPRDFNARWDDEGYDVPDTGRVGVFRQDSLNGLHGFPFHEACWSLLDMVYSPEPIPCRTLFQICQSLPCPFTEAGLSWGHSFGGLITVKNQDCYPWEHRFVDRDEDLALFEVARHDPCRVPEIRLLPLEAPKTPQFPSTAQAKSIVPNCFTTLPREICLEIASHLPTVDAFSARRAVRSFIPIFNSNQFWASRFRAGADRCWLFESREWDKTSDWRWLYHRTNTAHRDEGMQNRERVWKLIQQVWRTVCLRGNDLPVLPLARSNLVSPGWLHWSEATGDLDKQTSTEPGYGFGEGCRLFHELQTSLPSHLDQIAFSVIQLGDLEYIAGMRLIPKSGQEIQLGYRTEGNELVLKVPFLQGFNLAVGSRGIQGIQCVLEGRPTSPWVGCTHEAPKTKRLAVSGPIAAIKAGFDSLKGLKMVSLAVAECIPKNDTTKRHSLRDSAFWYPRIPGNNLHLNDDYFTARPTSTARYQPLCWTMFGGPRGSHLRSLTGMSVTSLGTLRGIEFHFNAENVPAASRRLGRYKPSEYAKVMHFDIDGPGGEFITAIEIYVRCCHFREKKTVVNLEFVRKPMTIAAGSTITGFYWSQDEGSLIALGVISESI